MTRRNFLVTLLFSFFGLSVPKLLRNEVLTLPIREQPTAVPDNTLLCKINSGCCHTHYCKTCWLRSEAIKDYGKDPNSQPLPMEIQP